MIAFIKFVGTGCIVHQFFYCWTSRKKCPKAKSLGDVKNLTGHSPEQLSFFDPVMDDLPFKLNQSVTL